LSGPTTGRRRSQAFREAIRDAGRGLRNTYYRFGKPRKRLRPAAAIERCKVRVLAGKMPRFQDTQPIGGISSRIGFRRLKCGRRRGRRPRFSKLAPSGTAAAFLEVGAVGDGGRVSRCWRRRGRRPRVFALARSERRPRVEADPSYSDSAEMILPNSFQVLPSIRCNCIASIG